MFSIVPPVITRVTYSTDVYYPRMELIADIKPITWGLRVQIGVISQPVTGTCGRYYGPQNVLSNNLPPATSSTRLQHGNMFRSWMVEVDGDPGIYFDYCLIISCIYTWIPLGSHENMLASFLTVQQKIYSKSFITLEIFNNHIISLCSKQCACRWHSSIRRKTSAALMVIEIKYGRPTELSLEGLISF